MPPNDVMGGIAPCRWEPDNPTLFLWDLLKKTLLLPPLSCWSPSCCADTKGPLLSGPVQLLFSTNLSHLLRARTPLSPLHLAGKACADHFLCRGERTFVEVIMQTRCSSRKYDSKVPPQNLTESHGDAFMSCLLSGGTQAGPSKRHPLLSASLWHLIQGAGMQGFDALMNMSSYFRWTLRDLTLPNPSGWGELRPGDLMHQQRK